MQRERLIHIDIAIGLAIILVVYGHLLFSAQAPEWYILSREQIYKFHMPLFMFFSGFIMAHSYKPINSFASYKMFIGKKARKFFPAYLFFSIVFIFSETLINGFSGEQLKLDVYDMLLRPSKAPAGFLWYVYVLFQYYMIFPLLIWLLNRSWFLLLIVGVLFQFLECPSILNSDLFSFYLLFIVLGVIINHFISAYEKIVRTYGWLFLIVFFFGLFTKINLTKTVMGLLSIPAIHYMAYYVEKYRGSVILSKFGRYTYYIYLMNTLVMGSFYIVITRLFDLNLNGIILLVLFITGLVVPIWLYDKIISKTPILRGIIK